MKVKLLILVLFCTVSTFAQKSYSEQEILQKIDSINAAPFSEDIKAITAQTLYWIQEDSGLEVMDIELFVNALKTSDRELAPYLIRSYFFGKVEHILENQPVEDSLAAKVAGLQNLGKVYKKYLEKIPNAANREAEKIASLEGTELREYVESFNNRDGLTYETAVVPKSIIEEYQWMQENYSDAKILGKSLIQHEGRTYDVFELQKKNDEKLKLYFDTSIIL